MDIHMTKIEIGGERAGGGESNVEKVREEVWVMDGKIFKL